MKIIFKHMLKSIKKSPWQSLVLILTIILSIFMYFTTFTMLSGVNAERNKMEKSLIGNSDIVISANTKTKTRFISSKELENKFSEKIDKVFGYSVLPAYDEKSALSLIAGDLTNINYFTSFYFTSYGDVNQNNINRIAFVTEKFAKERNIKLGSEIVIKIFGRESKYIVQGIDKNRFFFRYDVLINCESILDEMVEENPIFALFSKNNLPYNVINLKVKSGTIVDNLANEISNLPEYQSHTIETTEKLIKRQKLLKKIDKLMLVVLVIYTCIIVSTMVFYVFRTLSEKRKQQTEALILAGVCPYKILIAQAIELLICLVIGGLIGGLLSEFVIYNCIQKMFSYIKVELTTKSIISSIVILILVEIISLVAFSLKEIKGKKRNPIKKLVVIFAVIFAVLIGLLLCCLISDVKINYIFSLIAIFFITAFILTGAYLLLNFASNIFKKARGKSIFIASRTCKRVSKLYNVCCMLSVLISLVVALFYANFYFTSNVEEPIAISNYNYVILNAGHQTYNIIEENKNTEKCAYGFIDFNVEFENGMNYVVMSSSDNSFLNIEGIDSHPKGNEIYLPYGIATYYNLKEGDETSFTLYGKKYNVVVGKILKHQRICLFVDAKSLGIDYNCLMVKEKAQINSDAFLKELSEKMGLSGLVVQKPEQIFDVLNSIFKRFSIIIRYITFFVFIIVMIGAVNLIAISYAQRAEEFKNYKISGVTNWEIAKIVAFEMLFVLFVVAIISLIGSVSLLWFLNRGMLSYSHALFI